MASKNYLKRLRKLKISRVCSCGFAFYAGVGKQDLEEEGKLHQEYHEWVCKEFGGVEKCK